MHDIEKPITLEDLTNPNKKLISHMKSLLKKDSSFKTRENLLKKNLNKRKKFKFKLKKKNDSSIRQLD